VAGGVIAASVAVPVTLMAHHAQESPVSSAAPSVPQQQAPSEQTPQDPFSQYGQNPFSQNGQDPYDQSTSDEQSNATDAESQGVVLIHTTLTNGEAAGSGLVLNGSGLVLTNYHVVEGSTSVQVTIASDGRSYDATVVGHDPTADIALLQLDGASDLTTVNLDDDGDPAVSDEVTAVGNAQGQGFLSASTGSVVALDQSIDTQSEGAVDGEHLTGLIETNAYVVGGYSGGALLDDEGEVVGITTAASSGGETQSYAVPIDDALDIAEQIEDGSSSDGVQVGPSPYLGIALSQSDTTNGVVVGQVQSGGAAAEAGIEAGATITGIDGTSITSYDVLRSTLATYQPGDSVTLRWTDTSGSAHSAQVTLGESPVN
jgi:S1-C subfamily serine protease